MHWDAALYEFHVSRAARDRYHFDDSLFATTGKVILANFQAARLFAQRINDQRDVIHSPEQAVSPGDINAMGLIDELLHTLIREYRAQVGEDVLRQAMTSLTQRVGEPAVNRVLHRFVDEFPPVSVYRGQETPEQYLAGATEGVSHREVAVEELLLLRLANENPAFAPHRELFDDGVLAQDPAYTHVITGLNEFFAGQTTGAQANEPTGVSPTAVDTLNRANLRAYNLLDLLRAPARAAPTSLMDQLEFLQQRYVNLVSAPDLRVLTGLDVLREEARYFWAAPPPGGPPPGPPGPGPAQVIEFIGQEFEPEQFSPDTDWMPSLVLIAKNSYVWLHQLSRQYGREIARLDQIPDEELATLAQRGFTGLWLIGLWERSLASKNIKQMMGNLDAVASAYSLFDYEIATDLGGDEAYQDLKTRAWQYGIRLASDMVPNHMGIDSPWLMRHPDWFIQRSDLPYPVYSFNGPDLSWDPNVGIYLEDHYYDRSDAAVVFKRVDRATGEEVYIYHGNDGTSTPWNDTAQLNYLLPEVREAVIQTILHVARKFPVIRFDAAMTLAKKHFQRLWYPEPGTGGGIPSRAEVGMTKPDFDEAMPVEFWREVVDRAAVEAPETLLLAEAFWLMEGYFVRSLGMHRVYNSAFMNMLRDEDNAKYRQIIKNTLEFDPEILKRYVNFMNNPDERTAADQFGKGDRYFGIATVMATMPGLPMFGHGQVEGFIEKYGMEFRKPLLEEIPDPYLVERHDRELAPLLHQRRLYADVENFLMYDYVMLDGKVNENVYAYSNRLGDERALVIYHNRYAAVKGRLKTSVPYLDKTHPDRHVTRQDIAQGLALTDEPGYFTIFRDQMAGLEYIRPNSDLFEQGLYVELGAYRYHVFSDFREVQDTVSQQYATLAGRLGDRGAPSIDEAVLELTLMPVRLPYAELVNANMFRRLMDEFARKTDDGRQTIVNGRRTMDDGPKTEDDATRPAVPSALDEVETKVEALLTEVKQHTEGDGDPKATAQAVRRELEAIRDLPTLGTRYPAPKIKVYNDALAFVNSRLDHNPATWGTALSWVFTRSLGKMVTPEDYEPHSRSWIDDWRLSRIMTQTMHDLGVEPDAAGHTVSNVRGLTANRATFDGEATPQEQAYQLLDAWLKDSDMQQLFRINRYDNMLWFNREAFQQFLWGMMFRAAVRLAADPTTTTDDFVDDMVFRFNIVKELQRAEGQSEYQVEKLLAGLRPPETVEATSAPHHAPLPPDEEERENLDLAYPQVDKDPEHLATPASEEEAEAGLFASMPMQGQDERLPENESLTGGEDDAP